MTDFDVADASKWLIPVRKVEAPKTRLVCFHWVGGNGYAFRPWKKEVPDNVEIYSMMLPGRLSRRKEEFVNNVDDVVENLFESMKLLELTGSDHPPTVFFGHSYGGIIAYELAIKLERERVLNVAHLIISSTNCPNVLTQRTLSENSTFYKKFYQLSLHELEKELILQGALLGGVHIDILRASLPIIQADYKGLETYLFNANNDECSEDHVKFSGAMSVWGGLDDLGNVSESSLKGWSDHCAEQISFKLYKGSHFYFTEQICKEDFFNDLRDVCSVMYS